MRYFFSHVIISVNEEGSKKILFEFGSRLFCQKTAEMKILRSGKICEDYESSEFHEPYSISS